MSDPSKVHVQLPDVDLKCPKCDAQMFVCGYDFEPLPGSSSYAVATNILCDKCQNEFDLYLGGE